MAEAPFFDATQCAAIAAMPRPEQILANLKQPFRAYQLEALQRSIYYFQQQADTFAPASATHLLYQMATGSGKTNIMAALMLYLYQQGYRHFIFVVNSMTILQKTQLNFIAEQSSKYLFTENIYLDGQAVHIKAVHHFADADHSCLNIKFSTVQQLHHDFNHPQENRLTAEQLRQHKVVLIADEAHHLNRGTQSGAMQGSWEQSLRQILAQHAENILLEFTATLNQKHTQLAHKYQDKLIYHYDLKQFCLDGYAKQIITLSSTLPQQLRILQALMLNIFRAELAAQQQIHLKPVILFKAHRSIAESLCNQQAFAQLIATLSVQHLQQLQQQSQAAIVQQIFTYFAAQNISLASLVQRIQSAFRPEHCLSANDEAEAERNQILLNSLEAKDNPIRAIFAVQKLNEGWDVLNLFDIVRLYPDDHRPYASSPAKLRRSSISEVQLIGRGARYFPFVLNTQSSVADRRKFSAEEPTLLRCLECLYYHCVEDNAFIAQLNQDLQQSGLLTQPIAAQYPCLLLKPEFVASDFFQNGCLLSNQPNYARPIDLGSLKALGMGSIEISSCPDANSVPVTAELTASHAVKALGCSAANTVISAANSTGNRATNQRGTRQHRLSNPQLELRYCAEHLLRYAMSQHAFFNFSQLKKYFPQLSSSTEFIRSRDYLAGLSIKLTMPNSTLNDLTLLRAVLSKLEVQIKQAAVKQHLARYQSMALQQLYAHCANSPAQWLWGTQGIDGDPALQQVLAAKYAVSMPQPLTAQQLWLIAVLDPLLQHLAEQYQSLYLLNNPQCYGIYSATGQLWRPEYILCCQAAEHSDQLLIDIHSEHTQPWQTAMITSLGIKPIYQYQRMHSIALTALSISQAESAELCQSKLLQALQHLAIKKPESSVQASLAKLVNG